jgi:hypothetical protein
MENLEVTNEEKIYIVSSKIKFLNEAIYNYTIDLEMFALEQGVDPEREPVVQTRQYKENALVKKAALENILSELLANS